MLKRWLNIVLATWLINALVCYHPTCVPVDNSGVEQVTSTIYSADNTLFDVLLNHYASKGGDHHKHKIFTHTRYLVSRVIGFNLQLPELQTFTCSATVKDLPEAFHRFWEKKVFLPPHHHFLFRLSPF